MKKLLNLLIVLIVISAMILVSCKKKDNEPESTQNDYATAIVGTYIGDVTVPQGEALIDTIRNVSIKLTKVNDTTVSFYVNQNIRIASMGMDIPLNIEKNTTVTKNNEQYNFNISANVTAPSIPLPFPITITGTVVGSDMNLVIDITIGMTFTANYNGIKQ